MKIWKRRCSTVRSWPALQRAHAGDQEIPMRNDSPGS